MDYFGEIRAVSAAKYISEAAALERLQPYLSQFRSVEHETLARARRYLQKISQSRLSLTQSLIAEYPLKTRQGYAIMSLAECLERIPDRATAYRLIR